jgi:hypothetical protein
MYCECIACIACIACISLVSLVTLRFSGTPSDLLPKELGQCDYETGDDGKMLSTVLDSTIVDHMKLNSGWSVEGNYSFS